MIRDSERNDGLERGWGRIDPTRVLFRCAILAAAMIVGLGGSLAVTGESQAGAWRRFEELWSSVPERVGFSTEGESAPSAPPDPWFQLFVRGALERSGVQLKIVDDQYETRLAFEYGTEVVIERSSRPSPSTTGSTTR